MSDDMVVRWLLLSYRVPSEPSRLRATIWRRLKGLGAIYVQNSVGALPEDADSERALRALRAEIIQMGGTAQVLRADPLVGGSDLVEAYNAARDDEYGEIISRCADFETEIARETAGAHFTYGELEENDVDLDKLRRWLDKVLARDRLGADRRHEAHEALGACAIVFEKFTQAVYAADTDGA